jgi:hypothetical protein
MPTIKSHAAFRPTAERCFANQVYPSDWQVYLLIDEDEKLTLGAKLNRLCAEAVASNLDYAVLWDDDDFYRQDRIQRQVDALLMADYQVSGTSQVYYHGGADNWITGTWLYQGDPKVWLYGLAFPTAVWEKHPFDDISKGVDTRWLKQHIPAEARFDCNDPGMSIATIHPKNTCRKFTVGRNWSRVDFQLLEDKMKG